MQSDKEDKIEKLEKLMEKININSQITNPTINNGADAPRAKNKISYFSSAASPKPKHKKNLPRPKIDLQKLDRKQWKARLMDDWGGGGGDGAGGVEDGCGRYSTSSPYLRPNIK